MTHSKESWRLELAKQIATAYTQHRNVDSVILGGSTARGTADKFSDLELGIFWNEPPTESDRQELASHILGEIVYLYPFDLEEKYWADDLRFGWDKAKNPRTGLQIEVIHHTREHIERIISDVLEKYDPALSKQNLISGILDGFPLKDSQTLALWKTKAENYPRALSVEVLRRHVQIDHYWRWEMWSSRGPNLPMLYKAFVEIEEKLLHVLLALNKQYYFGFKWLDTLIDNFEIAPDQLKERLNCIFTLPPEEAALKLASLVEEVYDLIEKSFPELDVDWLRSVFRYKRTYWDSAPYYA